MSRDRRTMVGAEEAPQTLTKSAAAAALSVSAAAVLAAPPAADPVTWGAISFSVWGNVYAFSINHPT
ncbi:hypothetical protein AB0I35_14635 [Nocardia sp. NPDC050378]|uniref:hypothetical protein n=1 Tax=Nocardia sp. NPDC050378 TaxID=3155400 RepID=UPI00340DFC06